MIHQILPELDLLGEPMKRQLQVASAAILLVLLELIWLAKPKPAVSPGEAVSFPLYPIKAEAMEEGEPSGLETENPVRILIPSVSIDVAVKPASVIGNRWDFFEDAVSFWKESATPGEGGNIILYAHRATHFGTLNEAQISETVVIETNEGTFRYTISEIKVVSPSQMEVFAPTTNEQLTLLTCTNQDDSDRLIITAKPPLFQTRFGIL